MTLLDGDGPFNYSTLMQSAVNTLNQAAEEEAAYPSSLPLSPSLFRFVAQPLSLSRSPSHLLYICFTVFVSFSFFFYPLYGFPPLHYLYLKVLYADTP